MVNFKTQVQFNQHQFGQARFGANYNNKVANNIVDVKDYPFPIGSFRNTFYVCGNPVGTYANVPLAQHDQFRQLILKTKPVQTIALLLINYV